MWRYVYRAVDQYGQVIDVLVSTRRDAAAAGRFFTGALRMVRAIPSEVVTDAAPVYPAVLEELVCRRRGTMSSSTRATRLRPIMASSRGGCDRCAGYRTIAQRRS